MCAAFVDGYIQGRVYIIASPAKTGTTSVGVALKELGAGSKIMRYNSALLARFKTEIDAVNTLAKTAKSVRQFEHAHMQEVREKLAGLTQECAVFDIFSDAPFGHAHIHPFVRSVLAPDARFIWINRTYADWQRSIERWQISHPETYPSHSRWKSHPKMQRKIMRERWKDHRKAFRRLARQRPQQCLELELENLRKYDELAAFCALPTINKPFPIVDPSTPSNMIFKSIRSAKNTLQNRTRA